MQPLGQTSVVRSQGLVEMKRITQNMNNGKDIDFRKYLNQVKIRYGEGLGWGFIFWDTVYKTD